MFCPKCGTQLAEGTAFCPKCGTPQRKTTPQAVPSPAPWAASSAAPQAVPSPQVASSPLPPQAVSSPALQVARPRSKAKLIIPIASAVVVVATVLIVGLCTSWFGLAKETGKSTSGESIALEVKSAVADYSWAELSAIANKISEADDEDAALKIAEKYNLCSPDGRLDGTQVKSVALSDGTSVDVQIAGFYHDDKTDGGKAGITFVFKDAITGYSMNSNDTNSGGWGGSGMRSWLASDILPAMPDGLREQIVKVDKRTNNTGLATDVSAVTKTSDSLWLLSPVEICGNIGCFGSYGTEYGFLDAIWNAEGSQYQLFSDCAIGNMAINTQAQASAGTQTPMQTSVSTETAMRQADFGDYGGTTDYGGGGTTDWGGTTDYGTSNDYVYDTGDTTYTTSPTYTDTVYIGWSAGSSAVVTKDCLSTSSVSGKVTLVTLTPSTSYPYPCSWWTRSTVPAASSGFIAVGSGGDGLVFSSANSSYGVAPGFCL